MLKAMIQTSHHKPTTISPSIHGSFRSTIGIKAAVIRKQPMSTAAETLPESIGSLTTLAMRRRRSAYLAASSWAFSTSTGVSLFLQVTAGLEPGFQAVRPRLQHRILLGQADAVRALFVDVQFGRDLRLPQGQVEQDAVLRHHARVGVGVEQERRRRLGGHLFFVA